MSRFENLSEKICLLENLEFAVKNFTISCIKAYCGKVQYLAFSNFFPVNNEKWWFLEEDWGPGYQLMHFLDFSEISWFSQKLSFRSTGNSWGNLSIPYLIQIIELSSICGEKKKKLLKYHKVSNYYDRDCWAITSTTVNCCNKNDLRVSKVIYFKWSMIPWK